MTSKALTLSEQGTTLTAEEIRGQVDRIQQVMRAVMKPDTHYGVIPGTERKTLYKAGAEVLLTTFRIAVDPEIEDLSHDDEIRYRVRAIGRHQTTGIVIGTGVGEASSNEEKYRWREAVCRPEFEDLPADQRRVKYKRGRGGDTYTILQVRTNPSDIANTVLKMAKKRAQVDLCLTALAASDIFTQDIADPEEEVPATPAPGMTAAGEPRQTPGRAGFATPKQVGLVKRRCEGAGIAFAGIAQAFGIDELEQLPFDRVDDAIAWIAKNARPA